VVLTVANSAEAVDASSGISPIKKGQGEDEDAEFVANIIFLCVIENVLRKTKTNANSQQILLYTRVNIIIVIITLRVHCCCCCSCC